MQILSNFSDKSFIINFHKHKGVSSARFVALAKRISGAKKVGHAGTLDPMASGVLPIAFNRATKKIEKFVQSQKKYYFRITFGKCTDTDDGEGVVTCVSDKRPSINDLTASLMFFVGKINQVPSRYSAIKVDGRRAYDLARSGVDFELPARAIEINSIRLLKFEGDWADFEFDCSKGTYVRSLARDICARLGVCGFVSDLVRLSVGNLCLDDSIKLNDFSLGWDFGILNKNSVESFD